MSTTMQSSSRSSSASAQPTQAPKVSIKQEPGSAEPLSSTGETAASAASAPPPIDADDINVDLLVVLHDIVRTVEKDNQDVSQKNRDSLEASMKVQDIHRKIEGVREQIYRLPGISRSKEDQLQQLDVLKQQLQMKKKLIAKYKDVNLKVSGLSGGCQ